MVGWNAGQLADHPRLGRVRAGLLGHPDVDHLPRHADRFGLGDDALAGNLVEDVDHRIAQLVGDRVQVAFDRLVVDHRAELFEQFESLLIFHVNTPWLTLAAASVKLQV